MLFWLKLAFYAAIAVAAYAMALKAYHYVTDPFVIKGTAIGVQKQYSADKPLLDYCGTLPLADADKSPLGCAQFVAQGIADLKKSVDALAASEVDKAKLRATVDLQNQMLTKLQQAGTDRKKIVADLVKATQASAAYAADNERLRKEATTASTSKSDVEKLDKVKKNLGDALSSQLQH